MLEAPIPEDDDKRVESLHKLNILDTEPEERFDRISRIAKKLLNVQLAMEDAYQSGDYYLNHPDHHGTPKQRLSAFKYGLNIAINDPTISWWGVFNMARNRYEL